jgi:probable rRNA maturation factor
MAAKEEIALTVEIQWKKDIEIPDWATELITVMEFLLSKLFEKERTVSVYITDAVEMQRLNAKYRGKESSTDVLSWSYYEDDHSAVHVGDLAVSWDDVCQQADTNGWDAKTEMIRMFVHGCCHLSGLDHERSNEEELEMLALEEQLLKHLGLPGLYDKSSLS